MSFRPQRTIQLAGQYEPEGIYLTFPVETDEPLVLQGWGDHPEYHGGLTYNGVRLKGHPGIDLAAAPGATILAAERGRIVEISQEPGGFGRYIKIEHRWGESLYAQLGELLVETGQAVDRGQAIAQIDGIKRKIPPHLHFAIRVTPYNRFDGWGGFSDPTPFLYVTELLMPIPETDVDSSSHKEFLPLMLEERTSVRRP